VEAEDRTHRHAELSEEARGKLYGSVVIFVELKAEDGSLYNAENLAFVRAQAARSGGAAHPAAAAPFGPIPLDALGGATVLSFARTWHFTQGDALATGNK
jgi:protein TonB